MQRRPSSPALRYWLARLRPLYRPAIWGALSLLGLGVLVAWELSTQPDWLTTLRPSPSNASDNLSKEEQAIAADIDTLPLLLNAFGLTVSTNEAEGEPPPNALSKTATNPIPDLPLLGQPSTDQEAPAKPNLPGFISTLTDHPAGFAASNRLSFGGSAAPNATAGDTTQLPSFSLLQPPAPTAPSALATALAQTQGNQATPANSSALAAALARYPIAPLNGTEANRVPVNPLSPLNPPVSLPLEGTTGLSGSINNLNGSQPTGLPLEGSTGLNTTVPITPANNAFGNLTGNQPTSNGWVPVPVGGGQNPAPVGATNNNVEPTNSANPVANPVNSGGNPSAVPVNSQPFSVPRSVPGRSIGGGNINTFSNP